MTSTIRTNMDAVRAHNIFANNNSKMSKAFNNVATGLRLNSVQDGPSDWAVSEKMRERINSLNQANQNIQNDTAMMKTAEGGITNTIDILRTLKARVVNAADASTNNDDRKSIAKEIGSLLDQIEYNASSVTYNGKYLLVDNGEEINVSESVLEAEEETLASEESETAGIKPDDGARFQFQIGDFAGGSFNVKLKDLSIKGLNLTGLQDAVNKINTGNAESESSDTEEATEAEETSTSSYPSTITTPSELVKILLPAVVASDEVLHTDNPQNSRDMLAILDNALQAALEAATTVGSLENRLGYTADNVSTQIENLQSSDSAIRDSDMAHEVSEYMKWSVLSQASQYMLAQSNQNAFSVLNLLQ